MKTKTIGAIALATTLSFAAISPSIAANQQSGKGDGACNNASSETSQQYKKGRKGGKHHKMILSQLDLTDEQKRDIQAIKTPSKNKNRLTDAERATRQAEMQAFMYNETFDEEKAKAIISKKQSKHSDKKLAMLKKEHQIFQLLTDEQKTKYSELKMQHKHNKMKQKNR